MGIHKSSDLIHVEINVGNGLRCDEVDRVETLYHIQQFSFFKCFHVLYSIISDVDNYIIIIQFSKPCYKGFSKTASYDILIQYCLLQSGFFPQDAGGMSDNQLV